MKYALSRGRLKPIAAPPEPMHPALGRRWASHLDRLFSTGFENFESPSGISGLCMAAGSRLDLLAIAAKRPGRGECRRFIRQCQAAFASIGVWWVDNPVLAAALKRYGFVDAVEDIGGDKNVEGVVWGKPQ